MKLTHPSRKEYAASVLAVLSRFGYDVEKINGPKVHSLFNVMTMQKDAHDYFDRLELWLEGTVGIAIIGLAYLIPSQTSGSREPLPCKNDLRFHRGSTRRGHIYFPGPLYSSLSFSTTPCLTCSLCQGCPSFRRKGMH